MVSSNDAHGGSRAVLRKLVGGAMAALLLLHVTITSAWAGAPATHGGSSLLLDGVSGQLLYQQNGLDMSYPASTTKLLTALVAVERGRLDQLIRVSAYAVDQPYDSSSCYLEEGEQQPLRHLLYGLLLVSGNDCADAIAEGVGNGDPEQFMQWMNETAIRLGAVKSNFANPSGLHDPDHYTTALDLALIARGALANPVVQAIAATPQFHWPDKSEQNGLYYNLNAMVFTYEENLGGKTGYTEEAGLTLVNAARRGEQVLIAVVTGEETRSRQYQDIEALLDYGFEEFRPQRVVSNGQQVGQIQVSDGVLDQVTVVAKGEFVASIPRSGLVRIMVDPRLEPSLKAPVREGQEVGILEVREDGRLLGTVPVVASAAVNASYSPQEQIASSVDVPLTWVGISLGSLLLLRTVVRMLRRLFRRRRRMAFHRTGTVHRRSFRP